MNEQLEKEVRDAIAFRNLKRFQARELYGSVQRMKSVVRQTLDRLVRKGELTTEVEKIQGIRTGKKGPGSGKSFFSYRKRKWYIKT